MKKLSYILITCQFFLACNSPQNEMVIDWVWVEGGSFLQGENQFIISPKGDTIYGFTSPRRQVEISGFYMSPYEITVAQFKAYCQATGQEMPAPPALNAFGEISNLQWQDQMPMLATWHEAQAFAEWAGGRLATEAEWEYAAKGGSLSKAYRYSGSDNPLEVAWVAENSDSSFHPVGQLKANELGLYDMTGNLSEWVSDWYNPSQDSLVSLIDPQGPSSGLDKISKGVSWFYDALDAEGNALPYAIHLPEVRYQSPPDTRNDGFGFRIVKD